MKSVAIFCLLVATAVAWPALDAEWNSKDISAFWGIENRIIGGKIAQPKQFPYQARLMLIKRRHGKLVGSLCGGSLISSTVILTAAHCVDGALSGTVLLGSSNIQKIESTAVTIEVEKENFIVHEDWSSMGWQNDIALVVLPVPVKFNDAIRTISLPRPNQTDLENRMGIISGFGLIGNSAGPSNELRYIQRKILPARNCEGAYPRRFKSNHLCVDGSFSKSPCPGDSGGPLAIDEADVIKTIVGLTSFGSANCEMGYPTVYTRVTSYLDWIHKHTGIPIRQ